MIGADSVWQGDATYHDRHLERSTRRARRIAEQFTFAAELLDVGCNRGVVTSHLLRHGKIGRATGIELDRSTVRPALLSDERFTFIEGDVCDVDLSRSYDVVVYGAVHHHVVRERGFAEAVRVFHALASRCKKHFFFETGHLTEGARWAWQRAIRRHFRTDEEHLFFLLRQIEPLIADFDVVGRFWMHGARRWLIRIDMASASAAVEPMTAPSELDPREVAERSWERVPPLPGSHDHTAGDTAGRAPLTLVRKSADAREPRLLTKRRPLAPHVDAQEYLAAKSTRLSFAVKPLAFARETGIVYPFLDAIPVRAWRATDPKYRRRLAAQLIEAFRAATRESAPPSGGILLPRGSGCALVDVVDMNPDNMLVSGSPEAPVLHWVDFEHQSNHYRWKNRIHLGRMLLSIGAFRGFALRQYAMGVLGGLGALLKHQAATPKKRIVNRQPSIMSFLLTESRSAVETLAIRLLPTLSER